VRRIIPEADIEVGSGLEYLKGMSTYGVFDHTRAEKDLGFTPRYPLPRAIEDYIETLRQFDALRKERGAGADAPGAGPKLG
jgi:nucleoside-diphosphate-sugar epimerase